MRLEYHFQTVSDLNTAVTFYNAKRDGLGESLRAEVYAAIDRIAFNPMQYAVVERDIRRSFVRLFPYSILFRMVGTEAIRVLVIRHHRRHPRFGLSRQ